MNNAIAVISIGDSKLLQYSLPTIQEYCSKCNVALELITIPKYNFGVHDGYNYARFEKNQVYNLYAKYDRILRLDHDLIVRPNTPNLFDNPPGFVYATYEDVGVKENNRRKIIEKSKNELGWIDNWWEGYFNSGVVLADKEHSWMYNISHLSLEDLRETWLSFAKEQTLLNWRVRKMDFKVVDLGWKFNCMGFFNKMYNTEDAHIIHFAGNPDIKEDNMRKEYRRLYG
jgi:lipopolysaccharide biosynthesis glycosyltransferase